MSDDTRGQHSGNSFLVIVNVLGASRKVVVQSRLQGCLLWEEIRGCQTQPVRASSTTDPPQAKAETISPAGGVSVETCLSNGRKWERGGGNKGWETTEGTPQPKEGEVLHGGASTQTLPQRDWSHEGPMPEQVHPLKGRREVLHQSRYLPRGTMACRWAHARDSIIII